jgi:hypothetical protein
MKSVSFILALSIIAPSFAAPVPVPELRWSKFYNGFNYGDNYTDNGLCITPVPDKSGFFVGGLSSSRLPQAGEPYDNTGPCVFRFDTNGVMQWYQFITSNGYGSKGSAYCYVVRATFDGGVVVPVSLPDTSDFMVARLTGTGSVLWKKSYPSVKGYAIKDICQVQDSGFVLTGNVQAANFGRQLVWLIRLDKSGNILWEKRYAGGSYSAGKGLIPNQTGDSLIVVADVDSSEYDPMYAVTTYYNFAWLLKIGLSGDTAWTRRYSGISTQYAAKDAAGFFLYGTFESSSQTSSAIQIIKCSPAGDSLWSRNIALLKRTYAISAGSLENGTLLVLGRSNDSASTVRDIWVSGFSPGGDSLWNHTWVNRTAYAQAVCGLGNSYVITGGGVPEGFGGQLDIWMCKGSGSSVQFDKFFGGRSDDFVSSLVLLNKGYLIVGESSVYDRYKSFSTLIRTDTLGAAAWQQEYPFAFQELIQNSGSSWLFAGQDSMDFFVALTDTLGNVQWKKTVVHDTTRSYYKTTIAARNGGYYLVGVINWNDGVIVRLDANGNVKWTKTFPSRDFYSALQKSNNNLVLLTESAVLMSTDTAGNVLWQRAMPMQAGYPDRVHGELVVQTDDQKLTVFTGIGPGMNYNYIIRTDSAGNEQWHKVFATNSPWYEKVRVVNKNQYLVAGGTLGANDKYMSYLDSNANYIWEKTFPDTFRGFFSDFFILPSGNIIASANEENPLYKDWDMVLMELGEKLPVQASAALSPAIRQPSVFLRGNRILITMSGEAAENGAAAFRLFTIDGRCIFSTTAAYRERTLSCILPPLQIQSSGIRMVKIEVDNHTWIAKVPALH